MRVPPADHGVRRHQGSRHRPAARSSSTRRSAAWPRSCAKRWESLAGARAALRRAGRRADRGARRAAQRSSASRSRRSLAIKRELERLATVAPDCAAVGVRTPEHRAPDVRQAGRASLCSRARRLQVRRLRGSIPRLARRDPRRLSRATCRSSTARRDVLDVGCGRGEFLDLLAARGITRPRHRSEPRDGRSLPRARPRRRRRRRRRLPVDARRTRRSAGSSPRRSSSTSSRTTCCASSSSRSTSCGPAGRIVLETLNPACWVAFFDSYIRDITHVWPLHPDTLQLPRPRQRIHERRRSNTDRRSPPQDRLQPSPRPPRRPGARRPRRDVQRQRREAERADVHLPRLRGDWRQGFVIDRLEFRFTANDALQTRRPPSFWQADTSDARSVHRGSRQQPPHP